MGLEQTILKRLADITTWIDGINANSKKISEFPVASDNAGDLAIFNNTLQRTEKISRENLVDQNNIVLWKNIGLLPGNGTVTNKELALFLNDIPILFLVDQHSTPVVIECTKYNGASIFRYLYFLTTGRGTYGGNYTHVLPSSLRQVSAQAATPADINPGPNIQITSLGELPSIDDFLDTVNQESYDFTDDSIEYYFSYSVTYFPGTINEREVLYLVQFVGEPGEYGGTDPGATLFQDTDFVDTTSSAADYVSNQDNITIVKTFSYNDGDSQATILGKINAIAAYTVDEYQSVIFRGVNSANSSRIIRYKMLNKGKGNYGAGQSPLLADDIELIYEPPFRLDFGKIYKIGKGYVETVGGITPNSGAFDLNEKGDYFVGVDLDGYVRFPMRYGGTGDVNVFSNHYWETGVKVNIPGEPNYIAP